MLTDVDPEVIRSAVKAFFDASQAGDDDVMRELLAPTAQFWQSSDGSLMDPDTVLAAVGALRDKHGPWQYADRQLVVEENRACERHRVEFAAMTLDACVFITFDAAGKISRFEEFVSRPVRRAVANDAHGRKESP